MIKLYTPFSLLLMIICLTLSGGCMKLGPDYVRPDFGAKTPDNFENDIQGKSSHEVRVDWWQVFKDPEINRIVDAVLANNPDIQKAAAQVLEISAYFRQSRADRFPGVNIQAQRQKQHQTVTNPLTLATESRTVDSWVLSMPAVFELDLWGRLARAEEATRADLLMAEENRKTIAQSLVAEAISLYLQMEALERQIQINRESVDTYQKSLDFVEGRYKRGLISVLDIHQARRRLAQAEAALPGILQDLGITQQKLAILQGEYPKTKALRSQEDNYFLHLEPIPPGLPSDLLNQRPDVRAAQMRLMGLSARIGVAKAVRFPQISLTGSFGYASDELDDLLLPEAELWNLAAGITQPLFNAGKLAASQRAAEARYAQGVAEYAKIVFTAFSEVESALLTRRQQMERRKRVIVFLEEARATQKQAQERYMRGLTDYLTVLEAQQTRFSAEVNLVLVDLAIYTNRVRLHRALGGGWDDVSPLASSKKQTN